MKSRTTARFRKAFSRLPEHVQRQARHAFQCFEENINHPSLHFKPVHPTKPIYSVRIGLGCRAVGVRDGDDIVWFWIGAHADYDALLSRLQE